MIDNTRLLFGKKVNSIWLVNTEAHVFSIDYTIQRQTCDFSRTKNERPYNFGLYSHSCIETANIRCEN